MMKGLIIQQQQQQQVLMDQENMSNLTSASGDQASVSSENIRADDGSTSPQHYFAPPQIQIQRPPKKKRNLPGNPDPEAEVITLSPKTLMATNRFVCEVCNKGFQRDQNLQLHRRGHNLPWKLKQRSSKDQVKKKVYVCPEAGCVHHEPSRALGDLTGIKKHFCRKHGEKKWKCDKCSKRYAVQSDWKAHSKTCGTREYRCDCGTLFSRRDSFITHRAFCDALAEESARASTGLNPLLSSHQQATGTHFQVQVPPQFNASSSIDLNPFSLKKEQQNFPPWLACPPAVVGLGPGPGSGPPPPIDLTPSSSSSPPIFNTRLDQKFTQTAAHHHHHNENPNLNSNPSEVGPILPPYHPTTASAHMSATALLQKAAQMGATISSSKACTTSPCPSMTMTMIRPHHQGHVSANSGNTTTGFGLNLSSRDHLQEMTLASFGNNKAAGPGGPPPPPPSFFHQDMLMHPLSSGIDHDHCGSTAFEDALVNGFFNAKKEQGRTSDEDRGNGGNFGSGVGGNDGMTRDFLGLRPLSHSDIMTMAGLGNCINTSSNALGHESQTPRSW